MTKQTTQPAENDAYECTKEDLLDEYTREEEIIEQLRKIDDDTGLTQSVLELYTDKRKDLPITKTLIQYEENPYKRAKHLKWLSASTNRDGTFRSLEDLVNNHDIRPEEVELFTGDNKDKKFPYREINQLSRVKLLNGTEWIVRTERWYGLTKSCAIVTCPVTLGYYKHPIFKSEFIQTDKENENSPTTRVVRVTPDADGHVAGVRKYTDKYSEKKMRKYLRHSVGPTGRLNTITLIKENASNPFAIHDIERGITEDFDELWDDVTKAKPAVDIKELVGELRKQSNKEVEDVEHFQ
jgi:hypothetical protein